MFYLVFYQHNSLLAVDNNSGLALINYIMSQKYTCHNLVAKQYSMQPSSLFCGVRKPDREVDLGGSINVHIIMAG